MPSRRTSTFLALRIAQYGLLFLVTILVARALGPAERAAYALPLALASIAWAVVHLSVNSAALRVLGRREAEFTDVVAHLAAAVVIFGAAGMALMIPLGLVLDPVLADAGGTVIVLASLTIPLQLATQMAGEMLLVRGAIRAFAVSEVLGAAVQLGGAAAWIGAGGFDAAGAMTLAVAGFGVSALGMVVSLGRIAGARALRPRLRRPLVRALVATGAALHPGSIAVQLTTRVDLLVVALLTDPRRAGLYSLALTLAESVFLVVRTYAMTALQHQTSLAPAAALRYTIDFSRRSAAIAAAFAAVACALAYPLIDLVFGDAWHGAIGPFVVLTLASMIFAIDYPLRVYLARAGKPSQISVLSLAGLALNVAATAALIGPLGLVGAALASLTAFALSTAGLVVLLRRARPIYTSAAQ